MIALLLALSASPLSGLTVTAPANPDYNLVSRNLLPDGTIGECRRVMDERPGWMPYRCETSPFLGRSTYRPMAASHDIDAARWIDPLGLAAHGSPQLVLQKTRNDGGN